MSSFTTPQGNFLRLTSRVTHNDTFVIVMRVSRTIGFENVELAYDIEMTTGEFPFAVDTVLYYIMKAVKRSDQALYDREHNGDMGPYKLVN